MFCASYVYLFNLRWTGFTSPQPIVGRVYPSTLAFYPSKGRVDGSLDEAVCDCGVPVRRATVLNAIVSPWSQLHAVLTVAITGEVR